MSLLEKELQENSKPKSSSKTNWKFWFFLLGFLAIGFMFLMTFTNLAAAPFFHIDNPTQFQEDLRNPTILFIVVYVMALIGNFWVKNKRSEWNVTERNPIQVVESHTLFQKIRQYAKYHYSLQLGDCIKIQSLMIHKEAGSLPTTRFFLFENLDYGEVVGYSAWVVHYVRFVNIHLYKQYHLGRDAEGKYWTGEYRNEQHQSIAETTAGKKMKDIKAIAPEDDSMTDDSE